MVLKSLRSVYLKLKVPENMEQEVESKEVNEEFYLENDSVEHVHAPQADSRKPIILYSRVFLFGYWHLAAFYGLYLSFTSVKTLTLIFTVFVWVANVQGLTTGAHRLWSHKSFKATLPLQITLMLFNCIACQFSAADWVRNHRLHHKYSDTDADPYNATRGFFFSHIGWLLVKKHPEIKNKGKTIEMSDIYANPVLRFQDKYAVPLIIALGFVLPSIIPVYFWGESLSNGYHVNMLRFIVTLNGAFLTNSAAHLYGYKPYDTSILPVQNIFVTAASLGEGFHNFHHVFPWDYRGTDQPCMINFSKAFIDFFKWIGWAHDLKAVSETMVKNRIQRTGDFKCYGQKMDYEHICEEDTVARSL